MSEEPINPGNGALAEVPRVQGEMERLHVRGTSKSWWQDTSGYLVAVREYVGAWEGYQVYKLICVWFGVATIATLFFLQGGDARVAFSHCVAVILVAILLPTVAFWCYAYGVACRRVSKSLRLDGTFKCTMDADGVSFVEECGPKREEAQRPWEDVKEVLVTKSFVFLVLPEKHIPLFARGFPPEEKQKLLRNLMRLNESRRPDVKATGDAWVKVGYCSAFSWERKELKDVDDAHVRP